MYNNINIVKFISIYYSKTIIRLLIKNINEELTKFNIYLLRIIKCFSEISVSISILI